MSLTEAEHWQLKTMLPVHVANSNGDNFTLSCRAAGQGGAMIFELTRAHDQQVVWQLEFADRQQALQAWATGFPVQPGSPAAAVFRALASRRLARRLGRLDLTADAEPGPGVMG